MPFLLSKPTRVPYAELFVVIFLLFALYRPLPFWPKGEKQKIIGVLFSDSGLGDVGKWVVAKALKQNFAVRAISTSLYETPATFYQAASVTPIALGRDEELEHLSFHTVALSSVNATTELTELFKGADGIVVAAWSRQLGHPREAAFGMPKVVSAAAAAQVSRLVMLSSSIFFGREWVCGGVCGGAPRFLKAALDVLIKIPFGSVFRDLAAAEAALQGSALDYAILRPCGLDPTEPPCGPEGIRSHPRGEEPPERWSVAVAKEDVADACLRELTKPGARRATLCIGRVLEEGTSGMQK